MRDRVGLSQRVFQASRSQIEVPQTFSIPWRAGWSIAASLAFVATIAFLNWPSGDPAVVVARLSSVDSGGTAAEPLLVSLIAGSENVSDLAEEVAPDGGASAMSLLRARDASFNDLNSEVQLILASASVR